MALEARTASVAAELDGLEARREPARALLAARREAAAEANARARPRGGDAGRPNPGAYETAHREIEGLEADVEAARSEVFSAINSATALRHALEHAAAARDRVAETLSKLDVEMSDVRIESERVGGGSRRRGRRAAARARRDRGHADRARRRANRSWPARASSTNGAPRSVRSREHELAGLEARLKSLEELEAARAGYGDAARTVLVQANGKVNQQGADRRLSRGRGRLRARGRSLPRRSPAARRRRTPGARGGRLPAGSRSRRGTLRLPGDVGGGSAGASDRGSSRG